MKLYTGLFILLFSVSTFANSLQDTIGVFTTDVFVKNIQGSPASTEVYQAEQFWRYILSPDNNPLGFHQIKLEDNVAFMQFLQGNNELIKFKFNIKNKTSLGGTQKLVLVENKDCKSSDYNIHLRLKQVSKTKVLAQLEGYRMFYQKYDLCVYGTIRTLRPGVLAEVRFTFENPVRIESDQP